MLGSYSGIRPGRLRRPGEPGCQREGIGQQPDQGRVARRGRQRRLGARCGAARHAAFHLAQAGFNPPRRASEFLARLLLQREHAEIERDGIEAAGEDDARAGPFRLFVMGVDHAPHPRRFAAQIDIASAGGRAGRHKLGAVKLIRPDRRDNHGRTLAHRTQAGRLAGIRLHQNQIVWCADVGTHFLELVGRASRDRPGRSIVAAIGRRQIFGDETAGVTRRAIDDEVEVPLHDAGPPRTRESVTPYSDRSSAGRIAPSLPSALIRSPRRRGPSRRLRGGDARPFCAVPEPGEGHEDAQQVPLEGAAAFVEPSHRI